MGIPIRDGFTRGKRIPIPIAVRYRNKNYKNDRK